MSIFKTKIKKLIQNIYKKIVLHKWFSAERSVIWLLKQEEIFSLVMCS